MLNDLIANTQNLPMWGQMLIAFGLICFSCVSLYGRINLEFGEKIFAKIPKQKIRSNVGHIFMYTVSPIGVTIGYIAFLLKQYGGV